MLYSETALGVPSRVPSTLISAEMRHFCESKMAELSPSLRQKNVGSTLINRFEQDSYVPEHTTQAKKQGGVSSSK
jgi:hypothetical protein